MNRQSLKVIVHQDLAYAVYNFQPEEGPMLYEVEDPTGSQLGVLTSEPDEMAIAMLLDLRVNQDAMAAAYDHEVADALEAAPAEPTAAPQVETTRWGSPITGAIFPTPESDDETVPAGTEIA